MATNPFLVDDGAQQQGSQQSPDANHQALFDAIQKQTQIAQQRQQLQNIQPPNLADQSQHQPGVVKHFFMNYLDQVGRNLSGRPSAFEEQQANIKNWQTQEQIGVSQQNANTNEGYKNLQGQAVQGQLPRPLTQPEADSLNTQFGGSTYKPGMMMHPAAIEALGKVALQNKGKTDAATINQGISVPVPPDIATKYGMAPGTMIGDKALGRLQSASGKNLQTVSRMLDGTPHKVIIDKTSGETQHDLGVDTTIAINQAKAKAFANAKASVTPFTTFDNDGNLVTISAGQAIATGVPPAGTWNTLYGATGSTKSQGQAAGAVAEHIPAFQDAVKRLAAKGELGPVMGRLNTYLTSGYGGNDPDIAEFVTTIGLLKSGAVRAHFGAKGGQQILAKFDGLLNTAQTPEALIGSSNGIKSFLETYKNNASNPNTPRTSITAPSKPTGSITTADAYLKSKGLK